VIDMVTVHIIRGLCDFPVHSKILGFTVIDFQTKCVGAFVRLDGPPGVFTQPVVVMSIDQGDTPAYELDLAGVARFG